MSRIRGIFLSTSFVNVSLQVRQYMIALTFGEFVLGQIDETFHLDAGVNSTLDEVEVIALTGGRLVHGRPPAVVTTRDRDMIRSGILVESSSCTLAAEYALKIM